MHIDTGIRGHTCTYMHMHIRMHAGGPSDKEGGGGKEGGGAHGGREGGGGGAGHASQGAPGFVKGGESSALGIWTRMVSRTDELYVVAEQMLPVFELIARKVVGEVSE